MEKLMVRILGIAIATSLGSFIGALLTITTLGESELERTIQGSWILFDLVLSFVCLLIAGIIFAIYPLVVKKD